MIPMGNHLGAEKMSTMGKWLFTIVAVTITLYATDSRAMCARDNGKNSGGYQLIENTCSYHIEFRWIDEGSCGGDGCQTGIGPHQTQMVTGMQGRIRAAECPGNCHPRL
jgi:hypothetical protein